MCVYGRRAIMLARTNNIIHKLEYEPFESKRDIRTSAIEHI